MNESKRNGVTLQLRKDKNSLPPPHPLPIKRLLRSLDKNRRMFYFLSEDLGHFHLLVSIVHANSRRNTVGLSVNSFMQCQPELNTESDFV